MERGGREPWDGDFRQECGPPRRDRDRPPRGRNDWERSRSNSRFAPQDSEDMDSSDNKSKESDENQHRELNENQQREVKSPEQSRISHTDVSERPAERSLNKEKSDIISDTPISDEIPSKLDESTHAPVAPASVDPPAPVAPICMEPEQSIPKQETVKITDTDSLSSDISKALPETSTSDESSEQKSEN